MVRKLESILNIPDSFLKQHPFPGPGLAVCVVGDVIEGNALEVLRQVDEIFVQTIKNAGLYDEIWQAFAVFLPIQTVGIQGDQRTHSNPVALRAITSEDGMTADWNEIVKLHLASMDINSRVSHMLASIPSEALQSFWTDVYRKSGV
ncbi:uncharacterized protein LOC133892164 [Phragmites australis]|uniref:uncharacterized protein LOC133892164 n=1 Tax=Phragmites australis TaxID=29695 RepID=UPI002D7691C2|nr:uncharacterized protein LOC133892164 [Phragmites australis]